MVGRREAGAGFGTSAEPYTYKEVVNATSYPKVEVTNFAEVSGYENLLTLSNITTSGTGSFNGYFNDMFDNDTTTHFELSHTANTTLYMNFDLTTSQIIETMSFQYEVSTASPLTTVSAYWETSSNNSDWTTIQSEVGVVNTTVNVNEQITNKEFRYLRLRVIIASSGVAGYVRCKIINALNKVNANS